MNVFMDPVLRGPTLGCMLMGAAAALMGVVLLVRRRALMGESLSHAAYPGVVVAIVIGVSVPEGWKSIWAMGGAALAALLAVWLIDWLVHRMRVRSDAALCLVMAGFWGLGVTIASRVQFSQAAAFRQIEGYLYGQAATMTDSVIPLYALLTTVILVGLVLFFKQLHALCFDRTFALTALSGMRLTQNVILALTVLAIVMGIRTVGVVLMSAMLVAPAAAARQFSRRFSHLFVFAGLFGALSGWLGNVLSITLGQRLANPPLSLPTGPMIVLVASSLCLFALLLAPHRGLLWRAVRVGRFRYRCLQENLLKAMWRLGEGAEIPLGILAASQASSYRYLRFHLHQLEAQGWVRRVSRERYRLTPDGGRRACKIIRLHRLWELYLTNRLGIGADRVHHSAEEMEHILTPEWEGRLTELLAHPTHDPHAQPIPPRDVTV